jgi:transposase-like protein
MDKEIFTTLQSFVTCPYCGHICTSSFVYDNSDEYECPECEKTSNLEVVLTVKYTTRKKQEDK